MRLSQAASTMWTRLAALWPKNRSRSSVVVPDTDTGVSLSRRAPPSGPLLTDSELRETLRTTMQRILRVPPGSRPPDRISHPPGV
jgi:hypothetical protein